MAGLSCRTLPLLIPARKHPAGSLNRPRRKNIRGGLFPDSTGRWHMEVKRRFRCIQRALGTWTDLAHWMPFQEQLSVPWAAEELDMGDEDSIR